MKKGKFARNMAVLGSRFLRALTAHPVELAVLLHATAAAIAQGIGLWQLPASYAAFAVVAALCLSQWRRRWRGAGWLYWTVLPLYVACALLPAEWHSTTAFGILNALLPAAYMVALGRTDREGFGARLLGVVRSGVVALGIGGLLFVLTAMIYYSTETLFGFNIDRSETILFSISFILTAPLVFIGMEDAGDEPEATRLEEALVNWVLTPALLIYNVVLYVYVVWIAVRWQLPEGSVSTMVSVFGAVAMGVAWLRPRLQKRPVEWYFRWFGVIALPLVVLLWVAVCYRVSQYGLTVDRCLLMGVGLVFTAYCLLSLFRLRWLAYGTTALALLLGTVLAVGGPVSARQLSVRSQLGIARTYAAKIGILNEDGTIIKPSHMEDDTVYRKEHRAVYQAIKYLQSDLGDTNICREQLGLTSGDYLEGLSRAAFDYATAWRPERYGDEPSLDEVLPSFSIFRKDNNDMLDIRQYSRMTVGGMLKDNRLPVPGGWVDADSVLAAQLALVGYTPRSNMESDLLKNNADKLCTYRSADGSLLILFEEVRLDYDEADSCYHFGYAELRCALKK